MGAGRDALRRGTIQTGHMVSTKRWAAARPRGRAGLHRAVRVLVVALVLSLPGGPPAFAQEVARGRQLFQLCAVCHGAAGEGSQRYGAPAIAGLPRWYLEAQLTKFKQGQRGFRAEDTLGLQMRPMARALVTDNDLKAVSAYVAGLRPVWPPATLAGDPTRGKTAFALCIACHGDQGQGNPALGAPPLTHQADWYLAAQIRKFRQGLRGTQPQDVTGAQMRPMAMVLPDEQAVLDVVAYIRSLGR